MASLRSLVNEWLRLDQNETSRHEIQRLWDERKTNELEERMRTRIEFGTAGLRGKMAAGWSCMNDLIIIQASQGLCQYVLKNVDNAAIRGVVIGHDHRYNSERWAELTAGVFISSGFKVYLHRGLVHTPMVPFSVQALNASCGVYWENAVQIIGPHDTGISASIKDNLEPKTWMLDQLHSSPLCLDRTADLKQAYFNNLSSLNLTRLLNGKVPIKFVNTSMHGVSDPFVSRAFESFGFAPYLPVVEQRDPDPEFPTDLALRTADNHQAPYVLSQDPDGDRFCAAEKGPNGDWIVFTGDQLGTLFAAQALEVYKASGKPIEKLAMVASTVSSKMIEAMAEVEGFKFVECLTGFKFIGNTALNLVQQGFEVPFGYEEAIGFMFGSRIRDKDGVAATVSFAELVTSLLGQGKTVHSYLEEFTIDKIFERLRNYDSGPKPAYPHEIAGLAITSVVDLTTGYDSTNPPTYKPSLPLSSGHMIQFKSEKKEDGTKASGINVADSTSGTEPKIKYYIVANGKDPAVVVEELGTEWMEAEKNNLGRP
ncbi:hypothetical protein B0H10DRAFT_2164164 [Mycena sp. CBHHK59/15]|nr:hypothetical protein B0H10DRAFT_2164164 [Mycena sp. CBHHK59/15]